jgi:hypothetical protein
MSQLPIEEIDDIRQSPRQFVDLETVENLSDTAMFQDMQIKMMLSEILDLKDKVRMLNQLCEFNEEGQRRLIEQLAEARNNDRAAMSYLREINQIVPADDFPRMVEKIKELRAALAVAVDALEFMWRDVPMNEYAFDKLEKALTRCREVLK